VEVPHRRDESAPSRYQRPNLGEGPDGSHRSASPI
jgi:hypothetical protein